MEFSVHVSGPVARCNKIWMQQQKKSQLCRVAQGSLNVAVPCKCVFPSDCPPALRQHCQVPVPAASHRHRACQHQLLPWHIPPSALPLQSMDLPDSSDTCKIFSNHHHQRSKPNNAIILELKRERQSPVWSHSIMLNALVLGRCLLQYCSCCLRNTEVKYKYCNCLKMLYLITEFYLFTGCLVNILANATCFKSWLNLLVDEASSLVSPGFGEPVLHSHALVPDSRWGSW